MHNPVARTLRIVVFTLLLLSVTMAILLSDKLGGRMSHLWSEGTGPNFAQWAPLGAPAAFSLFMVVFALDRLWAVRRQHYPPARALMQVAAAFLLLTLLLPAEPLPQVPEEAGPPVQLLGEGGRANWPVELLLQYDDELVRQATCALLTGEILGLPHPLPAGHPMEVLRPLLVELVENDSDLRVRETCGLALAQLAPEGPPELEELAEPAFPDSL